jgi:hypothetical protein
VKFLLGCSFLDNVWDLIVGFLDVAMWWHTTRYPAVVTVPHLQTIFNVPVSIF